METQYLNFPEIEFIYTPVVNFAIQQNRIPVVRKFVVRNTGKDDLTNITVQISSEPEFALTWTQRIEQLSSGQQMEINAKDFCISAKLLSELSEKITGTLSVTISSNGTILFEERYPIEVLAFDHWNGAGTLPEMLSAFVTPNHPEISGTIYKASAFLRQWTGNPSFDGYLSKNPDRVKKQMAALYEAISSLEIVYCLPPASFENTGQRIRTCDTVYSQKLATCLDMAVLYAGCLEAVGLNPLLIVIKEHAFAGAWLIDDTFSDSVNDDISLLKKRTATGINEICLVETTFMNKGKSGSFDDSVNEANYKLVKEDDFVLFTDVKRARFSGIKPLPQRIKTQNGWEIIEENSLPGTGQIPEDILIHDNNFGDQSGKITKQILWERKLLDLSLRNNLLNFRITQGTIQLISINLHDFEDALANGQEFQVLAKPSDWVNPVSEAGFFQAVHQSDPIVDFLKQELAHQRLRTCMNESDLSVSLTKLYRTSRLSLEENGANTLYLAMGFLKWYETSRSEQVRYAPLLLLPVEIVRKSAQIGYVIRNREEDTLFNITLLEMLRQDFGITITGLDELPKDDSGVDVRKIFNIFRKGIMMQSRWDVVEQAFLGSFSFNKFIMWNDIHNNAAKLKQNKIVSSLISGKLEWQPDDHSTENENFDSKYLPSDIALPISADSTQLEAILGAAQNESFILHGPPGTGKSQTITNIIANALYQGKKVLFVAEKMAALTVVQKRLANIGLDPFCLELHSNKSKKSSVLEQLQKTTEVIKKTSPLEYLAEAQKLHALRSELNGYAEALHKKYPIGFSLFDAFSEYVRLKDVPDCIRIEKPFIESLDKEKISVLVDLTEDLQTAGTICGHPHNHPLKQIGTTNYSQQIKNTARQKITEYLELIDQIGTNNNCLIKLFRLPKAIYTRDQLMSLFSLSRELVNIPDFPVSMLVKENIEWTMTNAIDLSGHGIKRNNYRDKILREFHKTILEFNADQALTEWKVASEKWFIFRLLGQNSVIKRLKPFSRSGKIDKNETEPLLENLILFKQEQELLDKNASVLADLLGFLWKNGESDWSTVIRISEAIIKINESVLLLSGNVQNAKQIKSLLKDYFAEDTHAFQEMHGKELMENTDLFNRLVESESGLTELLGVNFSCQKDELLEWTDFGKGQGNQWLDHLDSLRDWVNWNIAKGKVVDAGIFSVAESYESGGINNSDVVNSFRKSLNRHCAEYIISLEPVLSTFSGKIFEGKIRKFKEKSRYFEELTKAELFSKLASKIPSFTIEATQSSEIGILQKAIRSRGRAMSVRKLFDLIPNLLPRMCPCMLMSPISVAQYFSLDHAKFDLVIFDEASQMPTCEAVGAIARAADLIVVGDPKQLPPTTFFATNNFDEDNVEKEDMESILDDCLALSIPSKYLRWHYRSKHESLIAFSNSNFYNNKLFTFPSPDDISSKVKNIYVEGYYDRGKTRQNKFEATAIVDEVIRRLSDPELSEMSIGIVAFSSVQQNLIEDLLNEAFKKFPSLESVAFRTNEPVFIKNLENVQGDERDVILFSVGYGPDKDGKISLNFGPLNREGGWRRLNVAVSRARYEMIVFSTLRSDQIDVTRTSSEGIASIKAFLEYSEKGKSVLMQKHIPGSSPTNAFEEIVAEEIRKSGFTANTGVGCSGYRINIGVVNPANPSEYLLGILTDGEHYSSYRTANDREILQSDVLKTLGWNIYKLWSPDWWDDQQKVLKEIIQTIKDAPSQKKSKIKARLENKYSPPEENKPSPDLSLKGITQKQIIPQNTRITYEECILAPVVSSFPDEFFQSSRERRIISQMNQVIKTEAPISEELLFKRVISAWGFSRVGNRLYSRLSLLLSDMNIKSTFQNRKYFYWKLDQSPESYTAFRIPSDESFKRDMDDIPKEEIANGVNDILKNLISLPESDLLKETARLFGFMRLGSGMESPIKQGIEYAKMKGFVVEKNGRLVIV